MNISARHVLKAKGKEGSVEIKAKLAGYHQDVLDRLGIKDAVSLSFLKPISRAWNGSFHCVILFLQPALPRVLDDDEDMDYEDEEDFMEHGHSLLDDIELHFTNAEDLAALTPKK